MYVSMCICIYLLLILDINIYINFINIFHSVVFVNESYLIFFTKFNKMIAYFILRINTWIIIDLVYIYIYIYIFVRTRACVCMCVRVLIQFAIFFKQLHIHSRE